jgi:hypothetical protein
MFLLFLTGKILLLHSFKNNIYFIHKSKKKNNEKFI